MAGPSTSEEFLELVRKSGVVDEKRLAAYLEKARAANALPSEPSKLAGLLVHNGLLTHFQAEQFLLGRWRRFTIGKYKVLERIGTGGMGSVYLCEHKFMRRRAAVKVLPTTKASDPSALERFYREARAVAALDHPNIVRAYDIDQEDNLHFLVMEYVDGSSLQDIVKKGGPLDPSRGAHYISQAAQGLQHAHEAAGLVHRDIKPGNLIVDRSGVVKVLDMGLARFFHDEEDLLTKKYDENVLGTADYLAPEQALDSHSVDIRADIYSLGATFYFCLTGRTPFNEGTVAQKLIWHQTRQPKPVRSFRKDVPAEMIAVVEKMMAKDPAQRYQTPLEVVEGLAPWTKTAIAPPAESEMPRLSAAALAGGPAETTAGLTSPPPAAPPAADARKAWQLAAEPGQQPSPKPAPTDLSAGAPALAAKMNPNPDKLAAPSPTGNNGFTPATSALPDSEEDSLPWEHLASDTDNPSAHADTIARAPKRPSAHWLRSVKAAPLTDLQRRQFWWIVGSVLAAVVVLALLIWWAFRGGDTADSSNKEEGARLYVSRSGRNNASTTIGQALRRARPHDHIVVLDDIEELPDLNSINDVSIEAGAGKTVVWRYPARGGEAKQFLYFNKAAGVRLSRLTFDGGNHVDEIILLSGRCPGLILEKVELRGFKRYGILIENCAGKIGNPVTLLGVTATTEQPKDAAIAFDLNPAVTPKINQHIVIRDCKFDGPFKSGISLPDPKMNQYVEFNREWQKAKP